GPASPRHRYRFESDDDPGGAGQRRPGPVYRAVGAAAGGAPGLLDHRPPAAVAVSLGPNRAADASDRVATGVWRREAARRDSEAWRDSRAPTRVRDASARSRR